jgi:hypothetical protein
MTLVNPMIMSRPPRHTGLDAIAQAAHGGPPIIADLPTQISDIDVDEV